MNAKLIYKPHPKESEASIEWVSKKISNCILGNVDKTIDTYHLLVGSDMTVSLFSTVGFDLQKIIYRSNIPFSIPTYLFFHHECREWYRRFCRLEEIPLSGNNMSILVEKKEDLKNLILDGMKSKKKELCYSSLKSSLNFNQELGSSLIISELV